MKNIPICLKWNCYNHNMHINNDYHFFFVNLCFKCNKNFNGVSQIIHIYIYIYRYIFLKKMKCRHVLCLFQKYWWCVFFSLIEMHKLAALFHTQSWIEAKIQFVWNCSCKKKIKTNFKEQDKTRFIELHSYL